MLIPRIILFVLIRRATYDYEKKLYNDHLESLQLMEKNYFNMAREVEKLRGELMNPAYADRRPGMFSSDLSLSWHFVLLEFLYSRIWLILALLPNHLQLRLMVLLLEATSTRLLVSL